MQLKEWIRKKVLSFLGLNKYTGTPGDDRLTFINDEENIAKRKIREYNIWYDGDSDELLNFYTRQNTIDYNYEPWYDRNKKNYFWAVSSTEEDIKRTHSGQPKNITDTLVAVIGKPNIEGGLSQAGSNNPINKIIDDIITENDFWNMYMQEQMPMTFVEGWGCYKINWDKDLSDYPIVIYYRAENVDFVYKSNRLVACIFKDYYTDGKKKYLLVETRRIASDENGIRNLYIDKEAFLVSGEDDMLKPVSLTDVPQLADTEPHLVVTDFNYLLAQPCIFYKDTSLQDSGVYGRSIFKGKLELFDDLDQCLSQDANTVRKSTAVEYFNSDFLERDRKTGMPKQPKAYDRKYTMYTGGKDANGNANTNNPVQVSQPDVDFDKYSAKAISILMQIVTGLMSPATLGIDISKRDNAEAQREKEKITVFTRNVVVDQETQILKSLFSQLLCANELMHSGKITNKKYDITVNFSEFADDSFENKLTILGDALNKKTLSPKRFMEKLYGHSLSQSDFDDELEYLKKSVEEKDKFPFEMVNQDENPFDEGM